MLNPTALSAAFGAFFILGSCFRAAWRHRDDNNKCVSDPNTIFRRNIKKKKKNRTYTYIVTCMTYENERSLQQTNSDFIVVTSHCSGSIPLGIDPRELFALLSVHRRRAAPRGNAKHLGLNSF